MSAVLDTLFGTRAHTPGAALQLPRKVPLRIEPKTWFACERTFLSWVHMAILLGGVSSALVGFQDTGKNPTNPAKGRITSRTVDLISVLLLPIAIGMIIYSAVIYRLRIKSLTQKQMGYIFDMIGPVVLAVLVIMSLTMILCFAVADMVHR